MIRINAKLHDHIVVTFVGSYIGLHILQTINGKPAVLSNENKSCIAPWDRCVVRLVSEDADRCVVSVISHLGFNKQAELLDRAIKAMHDSGHGDSGQTPTARALAIAQENIEETRLDEFLLDLLAVHLQMENHDCYKLDYVMVCAAIERVPHPHLAMQGYYRCKNYLKMAQLFASQEEHYGLARQLLEKHG